MTMTTRPIEDEVTQLLNTAPEDLLQVFDLDSVEEFLAAPTPMTPEDPEVDNIFRLLRGRIPQGTSVSPQALRILTLLGEPGVAVLGDPAEFLNLAVGKDQALEDILIANRLRITCRVMDILGASAFTGVTDKVRDDILPETFMLLGQFVPSAYTALTIGPRMWLRSYMRREGFPAAAIDANLEHLPKNWQSYEGISLAEYAATVLNPTAS